MQHTLHFNHIIRDSKTVALHSIHIRVSKTVPHFNHIRVVKTVSQVMKHEL